MDVRSPSVTGMMSGMDEKLVELEIKVAFQEETIEQLSRLAHEQQQRLSRLEALCDKLGERYRELKSSLPASVSGSDEKPPHY